MLAEAFDDDPFVMLAWRGKTRDDLLAALRGQGERSRGAPALRRRDSRGPAALVGRTAPPWRCCRT